MPWAVVGVALLALVVMVASRAFTAEDSAGAAATPGGPQGLAGTQGMSPVRAADISRMSPEERADRLYDRVMMLASQGKSDSVAVFAPMAIEAYLMLGNLNEDQHYDVGRIAEEAGALPLARARADSILARSPTHLLGLLLGARVAAAEGNGQRREEFERRLLAAEAAELRSGRPEYETHRGEIVAALEAARGRTR
jgi:hypothetical protein